MGRLKEMVEEEPLNKIPHVRIKVAVATIITLVLVVLLGVVLLLLLRRNQKPQTNGGKTQTDGGKIQSDGGENRTDTFSHSTTDLLWSEIGDIIAPTEGDFLLFHDPSSPQALALKWLQADPITLTSARSTRIVLERYALAVLYFTMSGPTWRDQYLFLTDTNACNWNGESTNISSGIIAGVFCNDSDGTVDGIEMIKNHLFGTIPWEIVLLRDLVFLDLRLNFVEGPIPVRITELTQLGSLDLSENRMTGSLPQTLPSSLLNLQLDNNLVSGSIPASWGTALPRLSTLYLAFNTLMGTIPTTFGQLQKLASLAVAGNALTGEVPSELGQISSLSVVWFNQNRLTGSVNKTFCGRSGMTILAGDCDEVDCPCCTMCCYGNQDECHLPN